MANKLTKFFLASAAILAAAGTLASCDDIEARIPEEEYLAHILKDNDELTNNQVKLIYDALVKAGTTNSEKVLKILLKNISKQTFGSFYSEDNKVGLIEACVDGKMNEFLAQHPIYNEEFDTGNDTKDKAASRVQMYYDFMVEEINKKFVSAVKDADCNQERSVFKESLFVKDLIKDGYDVTMPDSPVERLVNGNELTPKKVSIYFAPGYLNTYKDYIEQTALESLYNKKLTEWYLMRNNPINLGRSAARKVKFVKVADNAEYPTAMRNLVKAYADIVIKEGKLNDYDFNYLSDLVKGTIDPTTDTVADQIYKAAKFEIKEYEFFDGTTHLAFPETSLGKMYDTYSKITKDRFTNDISAYNEFTGNGAYLPQVGLETRYNNLVATESTAEEGWYTSTSLSGIPADLKNRLFNVQVAIEVDETKEELVNSSFGTKDYGNYLLFPAQSERTNDYPYVIYQDSATYIVMVEEAVSVSKLSATNAKNYDKMGKDRELFAYEVAHLISDSDTYVSEAKEYFIDNANIKFHDDAVYDYFANTFPDLFED